MACSARHFAAIDGQLGRGRAGIDDDHQVAFLAGLRNPALPAAAMDGFAHCSSSPANTTDRAIV